MGLHATVTLCQSCALGRQGFATELGAAMVMACLPVKVATVDCMSGCTRPSTCAFRSPGKTAYLFGDLTEQDIESLVVFARLYLASPDGGLADARVLGDLRFKVIARIPA